MDKILFTKMSGAGNDFIFIDLKKNENFIVSPHLIRKFCDRRNGIGGDGLITIDDGKETDFIMQYFNADGSTGSLCANGARCAIWFAKLSGRFKSETAEFISGEEKFSGKVVKDELIKFNLNPPKKIKYNFKIKAYNQLINSTYCDTGSPHVIINVEDILSKPVNSNSSFKSIDDLPVNEIGREIRYSPEFAPAGTNVNFVSVKDEKIFIRTYERGVENETLACGTGSVAAAIVGYSLKQLKPPVELITRGGDTLSVDFRVGHQKVKDVSLTGPAKVIFEGSISTDFLKK